MFFISICSAQILIYGKLALNVNTGYFHNYASVGCDSDCGVMHLEKS